MAKLCPKCGQTNPNEAYQCAICGAALPDTPFAPQGDSTGGVIPYKNPQALIAYYLGILSGLPIVGLPLGIAAFVLGILGLRARSRNPIIKGSVHAGIGIGCGCFFSMFWSLVILFAIIGLLQKS